MGLCAPRTCGCALTSTSLTITGNGSAGSPWNIEAAELAFETVSNDTLELVCPAGTIRTTIATVPEAGWLLFNQTVVSANVLYPYLWDKIPTSWKSGTSMVLPNDDDLVLRLKASGIGAVTGANTKTIATANLPAHAHDMGHTHAAATTGNDSPDHAHGFSGTTSTTGDHRHQSAIWDVFIAGFNGSIGVEATGATVGYQLTKDFLNNTGDHAHTYSGTTGGRSVFHQHSFSTPAHTGNTSSVGSGTALNVQEAGLSVRAMIKAH
jgi:microcystin-dependent protein